MHCLTGFKSDNACTRSGLRPFGLLFQVGGKRLIKLKSSEPPCTFCNYQLSQTLSKVDKKKLTEESKVIVKVLLTFRAAFAGVNVNSCCTH